ncbi:MAG: argininosuccinate synthase [Candidatus Omnitrophica bacterium]|nr:argininosuccinate synthase [Candidatus Omnitrophota bacterium]MBU1924696.1 argininosuccinate synthase [Candidatus Omnitrophota bacterium]
MKKKVVLAYSGGLDTSCIVLWLAERGFEVVAFLADLGQQEDLKKLGERAKKIGAAKVYIKDLKEEFVQDFILPAIKANAVYENKYLLATALGRPLIAKYLVEVAHKEKAKYIAHGCTGKGNDQVRIELTANILDKNLEIIAPVREWEFKSREQEIEFARKRKIPLDVTRKKPYSLDKNIWGVSIECGALENPYKEPPQDAYQITRAPQDCPAKPKYIVLGFEKGVPVSIDAKKYRTQDLISRLNKLGGMHGVGRSDVVENRLVGIKSREVYEAPAGWIIHTAHKELEALVLDRELAHFKQGIDTKYGELIYYGLWYSPLKKALDGFIHQTQKRITGQVRLKLYKGSCICVGRKSPYSLYKEELATYTEKDKFDQKLAEGFIKLWGMPYKS